MLEMATHYTKAVTMLGAEVLALRHLITVNRALAQRLEGHAQRELACYVVVLEKLVIQLET